MNGDAGWRFQTDGIVLAKITNPDANPKRWIISQYKVPFYFRDSLGNEMSFGIPQESKSSWIYISGLDYARVEGNRYLLAARTPSSKHEDFSKWEFRTADSWTKDFHKARRLCDHVGAELSVTQVKGLNRHFLVTTENGLSDRILLRSSTNPWGPWSPSVTLLRAPEPRRDRTLFCYAAKSHPELSTSNDEMVVSYICNTVELHKLTQNPHLYVPEFFTVRFEKN